MATIWFLAARGLGRSPVRTALVVLGLCVTGALLLDMTMLSGGLVTSLGQVLSRLGFAVRVVPKGTLPFSGDAEIPDGDRLAEAIASRPGVAEVVPVVATNVYVRRGADTFAAFALGVPRGGTRAYALLSGRDLPPESTPSVRDAVPVVINPVAARLDGVRLGDALVVSAAARPALARFVGPLRTRVVGIADFYFDLATQRSIALPTPDLWRLEGRPAGPASLILVRVASPADTPALVSWIDARDPAVDALSVQRFLERAGARLTYFNQFALILSSLSVLVSFLLITAIVTLSLGERVGEIAVLRALGMTRRRIGALVLAEGLLLAAASLPGAVALGLAISRNLDAILRAAPGMPENLHFFTLTPAALARTAALLLATGAAGGVYPALVASRLGISATLHAEVQS
jgi:putative ABC transport system permease protein